MPASDESASDEAGKPESGSATSDSEPEGREPPAAEPGPETPGGLVRLARRWGPFVVVLLLVATAVVVFRGGDDEDPTADGGEVVTDQEALVRSGPMTEEKAELLGEEFEPGPNCDSETGRIRLPTVYAPPCVEAFEGENGGATSSGVTEDTIKLVLYVPKDDVLVSMISGQGARFDPADTIQAVEDFVALYNETFETYGRRVELEVFQGTGAADDEAQATADAIAIAEMEPFAVIGGPFIAFTPFADELAARGVICLPGCTGSGMSDEFAAERDPYVWVEGMTSFQTGRLAGETIGAMAPPGEPAELAGEPEMQEEERVFGLLYPEGGQDEFLPAIEEGLAEQGIELAVDIPYAGEISRIQEDTRNMIVQLKNAGVTSVIVTGAPFTPGFLTNEATSQDYHPEWILGPNYFADTALFGGQTDQDQWVNGFGIGYKLTSLAIAGEAPDIYKWAYGDQAVTIPTSMPYIEPSTRMLFTGVQLAGPELTPGSFRDGLFRFPPSGDGVTSATVSWGDHDIWPSIDYGAEDDVSIIWWDPDATNPEALEDPDMSDYLAGPGLYRVANGGQRYQVGEGPASADDAGLFDEGASEVMYGAEVPPDLQDLFDRYEPPEPSE